MELAAPLVVTCTYCPTASSLTALRCEASAATLPNTRLGPSLVPFVSESSASYSRYGKVAPRLAGGMIGPDPAAPVDPATPVEPPAPVLPPALPLEPPAPELLPTLPPTPPTEPDPPTPVLSGAPPLVDVDPPAPGSCLWS